VLSVANEPSALADLYLPPVVSRGTGAMTRRKWTPLDFGNPECL
jgi:hypothetical protein